MFRLLNSIPYILAGGTILLGIFQLVKEWDEYEKLKFPWLRRAVAAVLIIIGGLTFVSLHFDNKAKDGEKKKSDDDIRDLKTKVQSANDAQRDNTKLFLDSLGKMSTQVGDLKSEVKTEALQKKLAGVQEELRKTQKALEPGPKAELTFTFVPYVNPPVGGPPTVPVTDVTLPLNPDGSVHAEFTILNLTDVEATNAELQIQICEACRYAKEPEGLQRLPGMRDTERYLLLPHQQPHQAYKTISLDIVPPPLSPSFSFGFNYRCSTCIVPKALSPGTVHIMRP